MHSRLLIPLWISKLVLLDILRSYLLIFEIYRRIVPETGGLDALTQDNTYSSHQRNYTVNNLHYTWGPDMLQNQYKYSSREGSLGSKDQFGSFIISSQRNTFEPHLKQSQSKVKWKKRSRNKHTYIGMTSSNNKFSSKMLKSSMHEGASSGLPTCKKSIYTPSKKDISFVHGSSLDGRKSMNNLTKTKKKKVHTAMTKINKGSQSSRNFAKIPGSSSRMSEITKSMYKRSKQDRQITPRIDKGSGAIGSISSRLVKDYEKELSL